MTNDRKPYPIPAQTILKGIDILDVFVAAGGEPLGLTEVSRRVGLNRMSTHRALVALASRNLLQHDPKIEKYRLGLRLVEYGYAAQRSLAIVDLATPTLRQLRDLSGESVALVLRDGEYGVIAAITLSDQPIRWVPEVGETHPHAFGTTDAVFWSALSDDEVRARLEAGSPNGAAYPTREELLAAVREARMLGSAMRIVDGNGSVGFAVHGAGGQIVGAIGVAGPANRWTHERITELRPAMTRSVAELEQRLGFRQPALR
jgi:DNA-binding IclR family transcriptional regulator